tara:strand:+ start:279 stop:1466 length:1188 start_codon:yes stop_codon:yes gene_type:complete
MSQPTIIIQKIPKIQNISKIQNITKTVINKVIKELPNKNARTKIKNATGKASVTGILSTQRVSKRSRSLFPYNLIKKNNLTLEHLLNIQSGVVVNLSLEKFLEIKEKQQKEILVDELDQHLMKNIGVDENKASSEISNVVTIITLTKQRGASGSSKERKQLRDFEEIIKKNGWKIIERNPNNIKQGQTYKGNYGLKGHFYYLISGGEQQSERSHIWNGDKIPSKYQLFTDSLNFIPNIEVEIDIEITLLYQMMCSVDFPQGLRDKYFASFETHLKETYYKDKSLFDTLHEDFNCIINGILYDPIRCIPIRFEQFGMDKCYDKDALNICHNIAVEKETMEYDKNKGLLSSFRPNNLFWGTHLGNMNQQHFTVKEYWEEQENIIKRRKQLINYSISS